MELQPKIIYLKIHSWKDMKPLLDLYQGNLEAEHKTNFVLQNNENSSHFTEKNSQFLAENLVFYSAPSAINYMGIPFFKSLMDLGHNHYPNLNFEFILDCGIYPGYVLSAFRHGLRYVLFTGDNAYLDPLKSVASQVNGTLFVTPPWLQTSD